MSLISFPSTKENIRNKFFTIGPQTRSPNDPTTYQSVTSELGYVVPSDRKTFITLNFSGSLFRAGTIEQIATFPLVISDFLNSGDVLLAGYTANRGNPSDPPNTTTFSLFYQLNGITIHSYTYSYFTSNTKRTVDTMVTLHGVEFDK